LKNDSVLGKTIEARISMKELQTYMNDIRYEIKELWFDFDNADENDGVNT
jgi:hypothetical protein